MRVISTSASLGVSLYLSPSSLFLSYSSASVSVPLSMALWPSSCPSDLLRGGVFGFVQLRTPSPFLLCLYRRSLPYFLFRPISCPPGYVDPVVVLPGFGYYVGLPP